MAGPWEAYQQAVGGSETIPEGPWNSFAPSKPLTDAPTKITVRPEPKTSTGEAFGRGITNAATFNFIDELNALAKAGGVDPEGSDANLGHLLLGAYRKITGDPEAAKLYQEEVARQRAKTKELEEEHPIASIAGNVTGAVAMPLGAAAGGATMGARAARGALTGAGVGAVAGYGEGEGIPESLVKAGGGAAVGGAVGAAGVPVVEGLLQGARAVTRPIRNAIRGAVNPEGEAGRRVVQAIDRDVRRDPAGQPGLSAQEFQQAPQATLMDLGGETTRGLARSAANTSPEGRAALNTTINDRFEGQSGRITGWLQDTFHYPNAQAQQTAIEQTARATNRAGYARAEQSPAAQNLWDEGFEQISQAPAVQDAIRKASVTGANAAAREGFTPLRPRNPFVMDPTSNRMVLRTDASGNPVAVPNLRFWDEVKKNLDKVGTRDAQDFSRVLRGHLDELVPEYQSARAGAAHFFGAEDALEAGQNFVRANLGNREARAALARMSETERQLFQDGFVSRFVETLEAIGDRRNVLNQIAATPAAHEKLNIALGPQRAAELEANLRVEGVMDLARGAVQGNSTTARQLAELGLAGGVGSVGAYGAYNTDPTQMAYAAMAGALLAGRRNIDQRVARRVAEMLVSNDPAVLQRGIRIVGRSEAMMDGLRTADRKVASIGGQQAAQVPALQAGGIGRADENNPNVQRPINQ